MANPDTTAGSGDPGIGIGGGSAAAGTLGTPPIETKPVTPAPGGDGKAADPAPGSKAPPTAADPSAPIDVQKPTTWPEQWRDLIAAGDKKRAERLARFTDPAKIFDSYAALERDLSSGKYRKALPTNFTSEELAEWRKSNGVPEKPDGYDTNIGNGIVWGEADKPHIDNFLSFAHANNMTPEEVKRGLGWWSQYQEVLVDQQNESDSVAARAAQDKLRELWGGEAKANINFLRTVLDKYDGAYAGIMNARMADGRRIGDSPEMLNALLGEFVKGDPYARDLPGNGQDAGKTVEAELAEIQGMMRDRDSKYWKGPDSGTLQKRFRDLVGMKERLDAARARG